MFLKLPQFPKIRDLAQYQDSQHQIKQTKNVHDTKDLMNIKTSEGEEITQTKIRSLKTVNRRDEVSFQEGFMCEHIETFKQQVQKFLQSIFGMQKLSLKTFKTEELFPKKQKLCMQTKIIQYYLHSNFCNLQYKQAELLARDLQCQQKLKIYLISVFENCCHEVAGELLFITNQIWQQYVRIQDMELSYQQLLDKCQNVTELICLKLQNYKILKFLTMEGVKLQSQKSHQYILKRLYQFLRYLTTTIFLVASQYFMNPYYQKQFKNSLKRNLFFSQQVNLDQFSDFQQEEHSFGRKKVNRY